MNQATKARLEEDFGIFNIHNIQHYSGNYKIGFSFEIPRTEADNFCAHTFSVMVRANESIKAALERTLFENEDDGYHD